MIIKTKERTFSAEIFFLDLDGTLIDKKWKRISQKNIKAIKEKQKEAHFVISTGRSYGKKVKKIMKLLDIKYAICQNGSIVVDHEGNILQNIKLSKEQVLKIVKIAEDNKIGFTINSEFLIYFNYWLIAPFRFLWWRKWKLIKKYKFNDNVNKIVLLGLIKKEKVWKLADSISEIVEGLSIKTSGKDKIIEVTNELATKGKGALFVAKLLGVDIKNTVHIGDSENDSTTLGKVGALIAVKNSSKKLLSVATHVGPSNKNGGIAKILDGEIKEI